MSRFAPTSRRNLAKVALGAAAGAVPLAASADSAFATHHLALQLSDNAPDKQALAISVSYNMLTVYGPDAIAIEVVTFAGGIDLLRAESELAEKVDSLVAQGVVFDVCQYTLDTLERETGKKVALNPNAVKVRAGVAKLLDLAEHGYTVVRP